MVDFPLFPSLTAGQAFSCSVWLHHSDWFSGGGIEADEGGFVFVIYAPFRGHGSRIYAE